MKRVGRHLILELWECRESDLNSTEIVEKALLEAVETCGAHLLSMQIHPFSPQGVTGVAVVSESHILIHTWPELDYAAVDVFLCGDSRDPAKVIPVMEKYFAPKKVQAIEMLRGSHCEE